MTTQAEAIAELRELAKTDKDVADRLTKAGIALTLPPPPSRTMALDSFGRKRVVNESPISEPSQRAPVGGVRESPLQFGVLRDPSAELGIPSEDPAIVQARLDAAEDGVVFDKPSPATSGFVDASFAGNIDNEIISHKRALEQHFGRPINVRLGRRGDLEYYDPETNRFAKVNPKGLRREDVLSSVADAGVLTTEIGGAIVGAVAGTPLGLPVLGTVAGEGAASFLANLAKIAVGWQRGINQDISFEQAADRAAVNAGITSAFAVGGESLFRTGQFLWQTMRGERLASNLVEGMDLTSIEQAEQVQLAIQDVVRGAGHAAAKFDMAQATNNPTLQAIKEKMKKRPGQGLEEFARREDEMTETMQIYLEQLNRGPDIGKSEGVRATARNVSREGQRIVDEQISPLDAAIEDARRDLDIATTTNPTQPIDSVGIPMLDAIEKRQVVFDEWASSTASALNATMEPFGNFIGFKESQKIIADFRAQLARAKKVGLVDKQGVSKITPTGRGVDIDELTGGAGLPADPELAAELAERIAKIEAESLPLILQKGGKVDFKSAWETLSELKRLSRLDITGLTHESAPVGALKRMIGALETDMRASFKAEGVVDEWINFNQGYKRFAQQLDEGIIAKVLPTRKNPVDDAKIFETIFSPGDKLKGQQALDVVKFYPETMDAVRGGLRQSYDTAVIKDTGFSKTAHNKWVRDHKHHLDQYFSPTEVRQIKGNKRLGEIIEAREQKKEVALQAIKNSFPNEVATMDPKTLVARMFSKDDAEFSELLMGMLKDVPETQAQVRHEFIREMSERIYDNKGGNPQLNARSLSIFLGGKSGSAGKGFARHATAIMGKEYVQGLRTLDSALQIAQKQSRFPNFSNTASSLDTINSLARAYVGIFTPEGRVITAGTKIAKRGAERVLYNALTDKESLLALSRLKGNNVLRRQSVALLSALGGEGLVHELEKERQLRAKGIGPPVLASGVLDKIQGL